MRRAAQLALLAALMGLGGVGGFGCAAPLAPAAGAPASARLSFQVLTPRRLQAAVHRWTPADVHLFRLRLSVLDGASYVATGVTQDVPWHGQASPLVANFADLAAGRRYLVDVEAWGSAGGTAATTLLNAQSPCTVPFDFRTPGQDLATARTETALVQLDGVPFTGSLTVSASNLPLGTARLEAELRVDGALAPVLTQASERLDGRFAFAGLAAGPTYVVTLVARDGAGVLLTSRTTGDVRFDPDGQDVEQDVARTVSLAP